MEQEILSDHMETISSLSSPRRDHEEAEERKPREETGLYLRYEKATLFRKTFEAISLLIKQANFQFNEDGLTMETLDTCHVVMAKLVFGKEMFSEYRCPQRELVGINIESVCKIFKMCSPDHSLVIQMKPGNDVCTFIFENECEYAGFDLKLMSIHEDHLIPSTIDFTCKATLSSSRFLRMVKELAGITERIRITINEDNLQFHTKGDIGDSVLTLRPRQQTEDDTTLLSVSSSSSASATTSPFTVPVSKKRKTASSSYAEKKQKSSTNNNYGSGKKSLVPQQMIEESQSEDVTFSTQVGWTISHNGSASMLSELVIQCEERASINISAKYLMNIARASPVGDVVIISLAHELPVVIEYPVCEYGYIKFYLAPTADDDDMNPQDDQAGYPNESQSE